MATIKKISGLSSVTTPGSTDKLLVEDSSGNLKYTTVGGVNNHTHSYAGSSSAGGSATSTRALDGFSKMSNQTWGVQTGTFVHGEGIDGCDWGFRKNCPTSGTVSLVVDGRFYQNEGQYACIDTSGGTITGNLTVNSKLNAGSVQVNSKVTLQYNSSTESLDFVFA